MTRIVPCLLLSAFAAACGPSRDRALAHPAYDTLPGGIVLVKNGGPTRWSDTNGWKLVLERTISPPDSAAGQFVRPSALVVDSRGTIFVFDRKPAGIKAFSPDGRFLRTIGREGSGPGEFGSWAMLNIVHDTLVIHDPRETRTSVFLPDGTLVRAWSSLCCFSTRAVADDSGRVPIPARLRIDSIAGVQRILSGFGVVRYHLDGSALDTLFAPKEQQTRFWTLNTKDGSSAWGIPYMPSVAWYLDRVGRMIWGYSANGRFVISRNGRDTLRLFEAPFAPVPVPDSLRSAQLEENLRGSPELRAIAKLEDIPTIYPLWTSLTVDGENNIWILLPGAKGAGSQWAVFTSEGILLGRVPATFETTGRTFWTRDRVYALEDDEDGITAVKVYRIAKDGVK